VPEQSSDTGFSAFDAEEPATTAEGVASASGDDALLSDLQSELAAAKPRLEAFARLEELADAQGSTPEAIAIQASIDVLTAEESKKRSELEALEAAAHAADAERQKHVEERDMLIQQREEIRDEIVIVLDEHTSIVDQMAEMIEELESIRADAIRLLGEKASLEMRIEELRDEVGAAGSESRRRTDVETSSMQIDVDEATAFDRFFEAEIVEDKARAWMLE
jgi:DNA repair exonuclease SbcCD ATPase subunit